MATKRSLSESSTGSDEAHDDFEKQFKKPRTNYPQFERRESQASTASSTTSISVSSDFDESDVQRLDRALDSNSEESDEEQSTSFGQPQPPHVSFHDFYFKSAKFLAKIGNFQGKIGDLK